MELLTSVLLVFIVVFLLYVNSRRPKNFPDGLARIPFIGQAFKGSKPSLHLWKTHKMMGHFIGDRPAVTIQDFYLAKDLFNKEEWCGRGLSLVSRYLRSDNGINKVRTYTFSFHSYNQLLSYPGNYKFRWTIMART